MCLNIYTTKNKKAKHLIWEDRKIIEHLFNIQDKSKKEIAKVKLSY